MKISSGSLFIRDVSNSQGYVIAYYSKSRRRMGGISYHEIQRIRLGWGAGRFSDFFFCCTRSDIAAHTPELLQTPQTCYTRTRVTIHAPSLIYFLLLHALRSCCTRCGVSAHAPGLLQTVQSFSIRSSSAQVS